MTLTRDELFSLEGRTALLTGAAGFLGRTIAQTLLANGARVIALGRSERLDAEAAKWAGQYGSDKVRAVKVDMYDLAAYGTALDEIASTEEVSVLINNAHELGQATGFNTPLGALEEGTFDQWSRNLIGGVYWAVLSTQKIGKGMVAAKRGSIVNISTMYAVVAPNPLLYEGTAFGNPPGYSASKAGLLSFTRYVASYWGMHGVRANAILPGPFSNTEDAGPNAVSTGDGFLGRLSQRTSLRRIGKPRELAGAIVYLASDASSFMTGQGLVVDGGWTIT